jgi:hypothetical protein
MDRQLSTPLRAGARAVTQGPRYHWFGYYDMPCWDRTGRFLLSLGVDFEHRAPTVDDLAIITLTDLEGGSQTELGCTRAAICTRDGAGTTAGSALTRCTRVIGRCT